jgi:hypothetical protein
LVGGQLILDVLSNFHLHCENTIPATNPSVKLFLKNFSGSPQTFLDLSKPTGQQLGYQFHP